MMGSEDTEKGEGEGVGGEEGLNERFANQTWEMDGQILGNKKSS
jgi:hypothetical protein